ncbi:MAG: helix-turn-helix transcriptional regulator [Luteibaculaceae bacterium]
MSAHKYAILRYRTIHKLISSGRYPSREALRMACIETIYGSDDNTLISLATIDKDLDAMKNDGSLGFYAPIAYSRSNGGYYYAEQGFNIDNIPINEEDLHNIKFAVGLLNQYRDFPGLSDFKQAVDKITDRVELRSFNNAQIKREPVLFEQHEYVESRKFLKSIYDSITENLVLDLRYQSFVSKKEKTYSVAPYVLKEYQGRWYVVGHDFARDFPATFALDRVIDVKKSDIFQYKKPSFDPYAYFDSVIGVTVLNEAAEEITISADTVTARYVQTKPIHSSMRLAPISSGGRQFFTFTVIPNKELIFLLLSYGAGLKVESPQKIANWHKQELEACLKQYE